MKLQNQDIWLAYPKLVELSNADFPIDVSAGIARQLKALQAPYAIIEHERIQLVNRYGKKDKSGQVSVDRSNRHAGEFAAAFGGYLAGDWGEDIPIERVALPSKITSTCEACGQIHEVIFQIDPQVLLPLLEHFIEIKPEKENS
jgi:hypothetical protein